MSIQSEINRITANIGSAYTALAEKNAEIPDQQNSENLAATILSIPAVNISDKLAAISSIVIEYGRYEGASYYLARIPKYTVDGKRLYLKVALTSENGSVDGAKVSALTFARREGAVFTLNAGLFNTSTMRPQGQTIIDGVSVTNTPMTDDMGTAISDDECYPLCIDANGDLSAPYERNVNTVRMIADGVVYAVTAWGQFIENFAKVDLSKYNEIVHAGKYIRQTIGQFQNGDYFVCTVDQSRGSVSNEAGMTYDTLADLLISKGVKFAYSLDGGGSAETVIGNRQINPIYENTDGRSVPTVLYFTLDGYPEVVSPYAFSVIKGVFDCAPVYYYAQSTTRACLNPVMFVVGAGTTVNVTIPEGYYCGVATFTSTYDNPDFSVTEGTSTYHNTKATLVSDIGWQSPGSYVCNMGAADVIGFNFKRNDNGTITDSDIAAIQAGFSFEVVNETENTFEAVVGSFDCSTRSYFHNATRMCLNPCAFYVDAGSTVRITIPSGYYCGPSTHKANITNADFSIVEGTKKDFSSVLTQYSDNGWQSGTYEFTLDTNANVIAFNFKRSDNGTITDDDLAAVTSGFSFEVV